MDNKLNSVSTLVDDLSNTSIDSDDSSNVLGKKTNANNNHHVFFSLIKIKQRIISRKYETIPVIVDVLIVIHQIQRLLLCHGLW
jgi:hypothetical protein